MAEPDRAAPVVSNAVVERSDEVARDMRVLTLKLEAGAPLPLPGQFYQVDCGGGREHLLPRPIGAMDARMMPDGLTLAVLVEAVGWGTARLCSLEKGESLVMLGPLGRGFSTPVEGRSLIVAGGAGFAPLHYLASTMDRNGREYDLMAGVTTADKVVAGLATLKGRITVHSDDGSVGERGRVADAVGPRLDSAEYAMAFACGPEPMLEMVAKEAEARGISCEVSLDARMACGIGSCRGCVKEGADGRNLCVCCDGPVFDSHNLKRRETPGSGHPVSSVSPAAARTGKICRGGNDIG